MHANLAGDSKKKEGKDEDRKMVHMRTLLLHRENERCCATHKGKGRKNRWVSPGSQRAHAT